MGIKEDLQERGKIEKDARDLVNKVETEKRAWGAEDEKKWTELMTRDAELKAGIERQERLDSIKSDLSKQQRHGIDKRRNPATGIDTDTDPEQDSGGGPTERQKRDMLNAWGRRQSGRDITKEQREACKEFGFNPNKRELVIPLTRGEDFEEIQTQMRDTHPRLRQKQKRDLSIGGGTSTGSGTIPQGFVNRIEQALLYYGPMFQTSEIIRTESGNDLPWSTMNDTGNEGALLAEATTIGSSVDPTFAVTTLKAYKYSSKPVMVSSELFEDTAFDLGNKIGTALGERLGRIGNKHCTIGTNSSQPQGIVVGSVLGKTAASATAIADTEILDLVHSVDVAYRNMPGVGFMFNDGILLAIRKLKDSDGRFIFQSGLTLGVPDRLVGYPIHVNNHMQATVATGTKTMIFGDLSAHKIRQVRNIRLKRLDERYADVDQVAFIAFMRMDAKLLNAGTNPVKHLIQA